MQNFKQAMMAGFATVMLVAGSAFVAPEAKAQEVENVRWAVPISFGSNLIALGDTLPWVADQLRAMSGGKVNFQVFEPGALVPALAIFESASQGQIDAGYSFMGYERGQVPASALYGAMPFGLEPAEFAAWMYFGGGDELLKETFEPFNVYPIFCGTISPEGAGWFRFPLESVDQLAGLKMRAASLGGEILQEVGMSVSVLPGGELYQALETGVLDATEFSLPTVDEQLGFYQVAKFYLLPGWHQPSTSQFLYVNMDAWNGLNATTQALIEGACTAGVTHAIAKSEALQAPALERFEANGVTVQQIPDEILQVFRDATEVVLERESARDAQFAKVLASMQEFQRMHRPWKELGYLPRDWRWAKEAE